MSRFNAVILLLGDGDTRAAFDSAYDAALELLDDLNDDWSGDPSPGWATKYKTELAALITAMRAELAHDRARVTGLTLDLGFASFEIGRDRTPKN